MAGQAVRDAIAPAPQGKTDGMDGAQPADQQGGPGGMDMNQMAGKIQELLGKAGQPAPAVN
jgi:hypothetical protein